MDRIYRIVIYGDLSLLILSILLNVCAQKFFDDFSPSGV